MESLVGLCPADEASGWESHYGAGSGRLSGGLPSAAGAGFEGWTKTAVTSQPDGALTLDSASATTIISFVPGVKIAFIELYCSGLTKKQTFQLDAVGFTPEKRQLEVRQCQIIESVPARSHQPGG
jgi:hypothetical protein